MVSQSHGPSYWTNAEPVIGPRFARTPFDIAKSIRPVSAGARGGHLEISGGEGGRQLELSEPRGTTAEDTGSTQH